MAGEYASFNRGPGPFVSTVVVDNWKGTGRTARMNTIDYVAERDGEILEGPTMPPPDLSPAPAPNFDPRIDDQGRAICDQPSPELKA